MGSGRTDKVAHPLPTRLTTALVVGTLGILVWLEARAPLRRAVAQKRKRVGQNLTLAAVSAVALQLTERPVVSRLARHVETRRWGLLKQASLPLWLETLLAVGLLDYTLYLWHMLIHRVPALWRIHLVHHVDRDLDVSTAFRFHAAEMLLSVPWRTAQVALIGVSPLALSIWQAFLLASVMFHHSNVRLPIQLERRLNWLVVTPRMHGIHHSVIEDETASNWSSGLTIWDWLHGTLRLNVPQAAVTIGVPGYREPLGIRDSLALPLGPQRPHWTWPDGRRPLRNRSSASDHVLLP